MAAAIVLGGLFRLVRYLGGDSLWLDESFLALNVVDRSFGGLLGGLDYAQGAPPVFMLLVESATRVVGEGEGALRLVPLLFALLSLPLFYAVARRILRPSAAVGALLLFACLEPLIAYSAQVKQYSADVFVALALTYLGLRVLDPAAASLRRIVGFGVASAAAITVSFTSPFVVAAVATVWVVGLVRSPPRRPAARALAIVGLPWLAALAAFALTGYERLHGLRAAVGRGDSYFVPFPPTSAADFRWPLSATSDVLRATMGLDSVTAVLVAIAVLVGAVSLARRDSARLLLVSVPALAVLVASAFRTYPFAGRFVLFLSPFVILLAAEGLDRARRLRQGPVVALAVAAAALVVADPLVRAAVAVADPPKREETRPLLASLRAEAEPGDVLFVSRSAQYALAYYVETRDALADARGRSLWPVLRSRGGPAPGAAALSSSPPRLWIGTYDGSDAERYPPMLDRLRGSHRVWVLLSHMPESGVGSPSFHEDLLDRLGTKRREFREPGAALYLYDLSTPVETSR